MKTAHGCFLFAALLAPAASADPWFREAAKDRGLDGVQAKTVALADLDGDGAWDLCLDRQRFYLNRHGTFEERKDTGIEFPEVLIVPLKDGAADTANGKTQPFVPAYLYFADLNNDGATDAVWGVHSNWETFDGRGWTTVKECDPGVRSRVYLNDGKGRFRRAAESEFSLPASYGPAMALAICDVDNDGSLDLYEGREYRQYGVLYGCGPDRLWKGDGKGGFTDITRKAGLWMEAEPGKAGSARPSYGVTHADWNNDGRMDLFEMAYGRQWNLLWKNRGDGTFEEVGLKTTFAGDAITHGRYPPGVNRQPEQPFRSNGNTFDFAVGDFDNDGDLDGFLGEIAHAWAGEASDPPCLLVNEGEAAGWAFRRIPVQEALPKREFRDAQNFQYADLHVSWADFDNDGWLDLLLGAGDYPDGQFLRLYRGTGKGTFEEVTGVAGFDWEGCGGLSIGDIDRDGDLDILAGRSFMRLSQEHRDRYMGGLKTNDVGLFLNEEGGRNGNHWLNVRLVGRSANRSGIGARITVVAGGLSMIREIRCGSGLGNHQDPPEAHFGLGKATRVDSITVRWPDGTLTVQEFKGVAADRFVTIVQGEKTLKAEKAK
ncbi:MAG: CRTAC1 family protein [Candidatus Brocadiae bacterium]|nr:CRTAC1 family protein [Candidatus Brocadiia bacterium]